MFYDRRGVDDDGSGGSSGNGGDSGDARGSTGGKGFLVSLNLIPKKREAATGR